jgi:hypothetical protein
VDEAIAWAVFCHARTRDWYADRSPDGSLLDCVQEMTYGLEVSVFQREGELLWHGDDRTGLGRGRPLIHAGSIDGWWTPTAAAAVGLPSHMHKPRPYEDQ